jgi:hypothetical protein
MSNTTEKTTGQLLKETIGMFLNPQTINAICGRVGEDFTYENGKKISKEEYVKKFSRAYELCLSSLESVDYAETDRKRYMKTQLEMARYMKDEFLPLTHGLMNPNIISSLTMIAERGLESIEKSEASEAEAPETQSS